MIRTNKFNKIKLLLSGLLLSLTLGIVDYDVLFISGYDYSDCENKENTELIVSTASEVGHTTYYLSYLAQANIGFQGNERFLINNLSLQLYHAEITRLFNSQNNKIIVYQSSNLRNFLSNPIYTSDDNYIVPLV